MSYPIGIKPGALVGFLSPDIYGTPESPLPERMAYLTPDANEARCVAVASLGLCGGVLPLSDCYRSAIMQNRAHADYLAWPGRVPASLRAFMAECPEIAGYKPTPKQAFSPPAGGSPHEGGRAIDVALAPKWSVVGEARVREHLIRAGWFPIAPAGASESWHFEFRGKFQADYDQVLSFAGSRLMAYRAMVAAMIADISEGT